jgi:hypothetical protein
VFLAGQLQLGDELVRAPLEIGHGVETRTRRRCSATVRYSKRCGSSGMKASRRLASIGAVAKSCPSTTTWPRSASECQRGSARCGLTCAVGTDKTHDFTAAHSNERSSTAVKVP